MTDIVRLLHTCYQKAELIEEFPDMLGEIRNNIADSRWHDRIQMLLAWWWLHDKQDQAAARRALVEIDIGNCHEEEVLTCYISVCSNSLSLQQRIGSCLFCEIGAA